MARYLWELCGLVDPQLEEIEAARHMRYTQVDPRFIDAV
jgi:hypothetical protein